MTVEFLRLAGGMASKSKPSCSHEGRVELLSRELDDTVWSLSDTEKRSSIERARKKRSPDDQIRNVDWLGKRFMFKGLYRDDKFIQQRIHPGTAPVAETWLVAFAKP